VRFALSVLAATMAVAASTGCSGDDENGGAPGTAAETSAADVSATRPVPPPDQSRWAQEVDSACVTTQEQIDAIPAPTDATSLEAWGAQTLPLLHDQIEAVKAVKQSTKEEETRRAALFVESLEGIEQALTRYLDAIRAGDSEAVTAALADANEAGAQARAYALSLDVTRCGGYSSD
jgi:hypothetical protein